MTGFGKKGIGIKGSSRWQKERIHTDFLPANGLGVRVETEEDSLVDEGVLLLCPGTFLDFLAGRADNRLNLVTVDQAGDVGVGDLGCRKARSGESAIK